MITDAIWTEALRHAYAASTGGWLDTAVGFALGALMASFAVAGARWVGVALRAALRETDVDEGPPARTDRRPTTGPEVPVRRAAAR